MFGFGKRNAAPAASRTGNPHQQQRAIPAELWDGEMGDVLRQAGFNPDDESNLVPNAASVDARNAKGKADCEKKLAEINRDVERRTGGGRMAAYFLFHEPIWNSQVGDFLMYRLRMFPFDGWNVIFLPTDERTAQMLGLPVHPGGPIPGSLEIAQQWKQEADAKLRAASAQAEKTKDFGAFGDVMNGVKADVWGIASYFANHIGAAAAWKPRG
jgi:hypothetical protein